MSVFQILCTITVLYVTADLIASWYVVRRLGGIRAAWSQIRVNIHAWRSGNGDDQSDNSFEK